MQENRTPKESPKQQNYKCCRLGLITEAVYNHIHANTLDLKVDRSTTRIYLIYINISDINLKKQYKYWWDILMKYVLKKNCQIFLDG